MSGDAENGTPAAADHETLQDRRRGARDRRRHPGPFDWILDLGTDFVQNFIGEGDHG